MGSKSSITVSAPCKVHLLGEHSVVYGKPAIIATVNLRVFVTISATPSPIIPASPSVIPTNVGIQLNNTVKKVVEPIIKKYLHLKKLPPYHLTIHSETPIGAGLGSSAAISASYIAALLSFLKIKWNLNLVYNLTYEAEKVFHGNPSGADPATVIYGGLIWFRKEALDLKLIQPFPFSIPKKLSKNFVLVNTGTSEENTKVMVTSVKNLYDKKTRIVERFLETQEKLVRELLPVLKIGDEKELIRIIRAGEKNLESIGVCSPYAKKIIRQIESSGGAAKICGGGGKTKEVGVLLAYHPNKKELLKVVKSYNLPYFKTKLGIQGLRVE